MWKKSHSEINYSHEEFFHTWKKNCLEIKCEKIKRKNILIIQIIHEVKQLNRGNDPEMKQ